MSLAVDWKAKALIVVTLGSLGCQPPPPPPPPTPPTPPPVASTPALEAPIKAEAGVGKQGQSLKDSKGVGRMIVQPAISLFAVKQRAVFEIQIPQAMQLFQASTGNPPKSHDEFMTQIVKANNINLPELPAGQVYKYHPDTADLWVHPANE